MPTSILQLCRTLADFLTAVVASLVAMWPWEAIAVLLAIAYLVLAIRQNILCWAAALASTSIYLVLMLQVGLYMESALQLFYMAMAVYGWYAWRQGPEPGQELPVTSWPPAFNLPPLLLIALLTLISGYLLDRNTAAALPYLDSFTTWGAVISTWMVARKIIQNWHYWFVIDSVSVYLYMSRGLWLTALLFLLYLVLIIIGYRAWLASMIATQRLR
jgi:nicotinamide mononucleotide transporter